MIGFLGLLSSLSDFMLDLFSVRFWFKIVALACLGMLGVAFYQQYYHLRMPCPLCLLQRFCIFVVALFAILGLWHRSRRLWVNRLYAIAMAGAAFAGALVAMRHAYLQYVPTEHLSCGADLAFMLDSMPYHRVLLSVLSGSAECSKVDWLLWGWSIPVWVALSCIVLTCCSVVGACCKK